MRSVIVQKWPEWLQKQIIHLNPIFTSKRMYIVENDDSFITVDSVQCLPNDFPTDMDVAAKSVAVQKLKDVLSRIPHDINTIVFFNGLQNDGTISTVDYIYSDTELPEFITTRTHIINYLNQDEPSEDELDGCPIVPEDTVPTVNIALTMDDLKDEVHEKINDRRNSISPQNEEDVQTQTEQLNYENGIGEIEKGGDGGEDGKDGDGREGGEGGDGGDGGDGGNGGENSIVDDEEPSWLAEASEVSKQIPSLVNTSTIEENNERKMYTTIVSDGLPVLELQGILTPRLVESLAPQRVVLPLKSNSVVMISGTKKVVRIGQWTIDIGSFNEEEQTYQSSSQQKVPTRVYNTRNRRNVSKGTIKTLHSLKKLQHQRR